MITDLEAKVYKVQFSENPLDEYKNLEDALLACMDVGGEDGLKHVLKLFTHFDSGILFEKDFQRVTALITVYWKSKGLEKLVQTAIEACEFRCEIVALEILAFSASISLASYASLMLKSFPRLIDKLNLANPDYVSPEFANAAKRNLVNFAINTSPDEQVPTNLMSTLHFLGMFEKMGFSSAFGVLLSAFNYRWFQLSDETLRKYEELIFSSTISEEDVQVYLENHPQILDPFFAHIWPKVRLGEKYIADFIIRLMDDQYVVVEIEKPTDSIMTLQGDLSAKTNHAIRQALEYREWLISNQLYARQTFTNIWRPSCLIVIGLESRLSDTQKHRLQQENESRHGNVHIVGFDWLHKRSISILNNLVNSGIDRFHITS